MKERKKIQETDQFCLGYSCSDVTMPLACSSVILGQVAALSNFFFVCLFSQPEYDAQKSKLVIQTVVLTYGSMYNDASGPYFGTQYVV